MRIASLLPSATEIVYALGLGRDLVAVTHECDYPPVARRKPAVTSSVIGHQVGDSAAIHALVSGRLHAGSSIYHLDHLALRQLEPDLILTQELCAVCAVSYTEVKAAARLLPGPPKVVSLEPTTVGEILSTVVTVGEEAGERQRAETVVTGLRQRLARVVSRVNRGGKRPRVACFEWLDPIFIAGHWVPEMVAMAGGKDGLGQPGRPSTQRPWEEVVDYQPEVIILMPCGFNVGRTLREFRRMPRPAAWERLPAVRRGRVYAVNGSAYFNRPGPRIVAGLELLARLLHPESFEPPQPLWARGAFKQLA